MLKRELAEQIHVADLPNGTTVIIAHPGQPVETDPTKLRQLYGVTSPGSVRRLSESREAPLTAEEARADEVELLKARLAELAGPEGGATAKKG